MYSAGIYDFCLSSFYLFRNDIDSCINFSYLRGNLFLYILFTNGGIQRLFGRYLRFSEDFLYLRKLQFYMVQSIYLAKGFLYTGKCLFLISNNLFDFKTRRRRL